MKTQRSKKTIKDQLNSTQINKLINPQDVRKLFERLHHQKQNSKKKIQELRKRQNQVNQEKLSNQCTFHPTIIKNQFTPQKNNFLDRASSWSNSKIKKIQAMRAEKQKKQEINYSFKPEIHQKPNTPVYQYSKKIKRQKKGYLNIHIDKASKLKQKTHAIVKPFQLSAYKKKNNSQILVRNQQNHQEQNNQHRGNQLFIVPKNSWQNNTIQIVNQEQQQHQYEQYDYKQHSQNLNQPISKGNIFTMGDTEAEAYYNPQSLQIPQQQYKEQMRLHSTQRPYMFNLGDDQSED